MKRFTLTIMVSVLLVLLSLPSTAASKVYQVQSGDTLWKISQEAGIPIEIIIQNNALNNPGNLYVGQKLFISISIQNNNSNYNYRNYTVKSGDTIWSIAQKYGSTIEAIVAANQLEAPYYIYSGQNLLIPGQASSTITEDYSTPVNSNYNYFPYSFYQVKEGDAIWTIADYFGVRVSSLVNYNNLEDLNQLQAGDILIIPLKQSDKMSYLKQSSSQLNNYYRVRNGETLAEIAEYFKVPAEGLRAINEMTANEEVYPGQQLLMPVSPALFDQHTLYQVKSGGEYLHEIAFNHGVSIRSILQANYLRDQNAKFSEGTTILIPLNEESQALWVEYDENGNPQNSWFN